MKAELTRDISVEVTEVTSLFICFSKFETHNHNEQVCLQLFEDKGRIRASECHHSYHIYLRIEYDCCSMSIVLTQSHKTLHSCEEYPL